MKPTPWKYINSWNCIACGLCCKAYDVVLKYPEWLKIIQTYGIGTTRPGRNQFYLGKKANGSCIFLYRFFDRWLCALQQMKPMACKLWPFKVYSHPKYGRSNQASYEYMGREFFIYVDSGCLGLRFGRNPSNQLISETIPEVIEIALGLREKQFYSTSRMPLYVKEWSFRARKVI
ncbi:MAG: YkgJ family cysteine cluster protein [Candidatus Bathyarchaeia archaeon]